MSNALCTSKIPFKASIEREYSGMALRVVIHFLKVTGNSKASRISRMRFQDTKPKAFMISIFYALLPGVLFLQ